MLRKWEKSTYRRMYVRFFFHKLADFHLAASLRINFFMNNYFSFLYKILEKLLWNKFLLHPLVVVIALKNQSSAGFLSKDIRKKFPKFTETQLCLSLFLIKVLGWKSVTVRSNHWRSSVKKVFIKVSQISQESTCFGVSF